MNLHEMAYYVLLVVLVSYANVLFYGKGGLGPRSFLIIDLKSCSLSFYS